MYFPCGSVLVSVASCRRCLARSRPHIIFLGPPVGLHGGGLRDIGESSRLASDPLAETWVELEAGMSEGWRRDLQLTS